MALNRHRGGAGDPLVLVHGLAASWPGWARVLPALERRHTVYALDLPGFGGSAPDGTPPTVAGQAERVERFFAEEGIERPHVAGVSMGGGIALELARRGSVRSATAFAPVGFWTERERAWCQRSLAAELSLARTVGPLASPLLATALGRTLLLPLVLGRPWRMTAAEARDLVAAAASCPGFAACAAAFTGHRFHDPDALRGVPVTVAWGDRDILLLFRQAARARRMLPFARHVTLPGCGHYPFTDDPERCARVILEGARAGASRTPPSAATAA